MKTVLLLPSAFVLSILAFSFHSALAHEEVVFGDIKIVGGWVNEPPLADQLNGIVLEITRVSDGQPVNNAVAQLDVAVKKGLPTKPLDFQPTEEPGVYTATILPTQTGQYAIVMKGTIAGQSIDSQIEIEDVGDTARFDFPPASNGGSEIPQEVIEQLQAVISDLTAQVDAANVVAEEAKTAAAGAAESSAESKMAADRAYLFGIIGVGIGVGGIAIGAAALSRKEKV